MAARFVVLGPISDDSSLELVIDRILGTIGNPVAFSERPANDYLGHPYAGEYEKIHEAVVSISRLMRNRSDLAEVDRLESPEEIAASAGWNIHMFRPSVWTVGLLLIIGRREAKDSDWRQAAASRFPIPADIMSYERLLDVPGSSDFSVSSLS